MSPDRLHIVFDSGPSCSSAHTGILFPFYSRAWVTFTEAWVRHRIFKCAQWQSSIWSALTHLERSFPLQMISGQYWRRCARPSLIGEPVWLLSVSLPVQILHLSNLLSSVLYSSFSNVRKLHFSLFWKVMKFISHLKLCKCVLGVYFLTFSDIYGLNSKLVNQTDSQKTNPLGK